MGKLPNEELEKLLGCIRKNECVIVPPKVGYDSGVHKIGDKYLVVSTDPCTGVPEEWFGYLLINYAASDVALFGAKPQFCTINLLAKPGCEPEAFLQVMKQTCHAANDLGIAIVTGHTGTYESISELVGVCTAYGTIEKEKLHTPADADSGDLILCTKPLGLETVVNFVLAHKVFAKRLFGAERAEKLAKMVYMQSCVKEALSLANVPGVHAMHDATEGGLVAALNELAQASGVGFTIHSRQVRFAPELRIFEHKFGLSEDQMLAISSTGTILAAVSPNSEKGVRKTLSSHGLNAAFLGTFSKSKKRIIIREQTETTFPSAADDPYAKILLGKGLRQLNQD